MKKGGEEYLLHRIPSSEQAAASKLVSFGMGHMEGQWKPSLKLKKSKAMKLLGFFYLFYN